MAGKWSLRQTLLRALVIAVVASALFGIYAFLFGDFGETEVKILLTTLAISYFSVTSLSCASALEKRRSGVLAPLGLAVGIVGFLAFLPGIWAEWWESEMLGKPMAILAIFAFSLAQVCLLTLVPLERSVRWAFSATATVVLVLAAFVSGLIVFEADDEWFFRIAGVLAILDGCGSLLIPVLYKLGGRPPIGVQENERLDYIELSCPRCGRKGKYAVGIIECGGCSLTMAVKIANAEGDNNGCSDSTESCDHHNNNPRSKSGRGSEKMVRRYRTLLR